MKKILLVSATLLTIGGAAVVASVFPVEESNATALYPNARYVKGPTCAPGLPSVIYMDPACDMSNSCYIYEGIVYRSTQGLACD